MNKENLLHSCKAIRRHTLLRLYLRFLLYFIAAKLIFILANPSPTGEETIADYAAAIWHGLPLDLATSAYLTAIPLAGSLLRLWTGCPVRIPLRIYSATVAVLLPLICLADTVLYGYWGIKLDGTVFNYLDQPEGITNSVSMGFLLLLTTAYLILVPATYFMLATLTPQSRPARQSVRRKWTRTGLYLLEGGLLFLAMRGGVGKSTANVGMVYFSQNTYLNHCAVNPAFSIVSSLFKTKDFSRIHDHFPEERRASLFASLHYRTEGQTLDTLLREQRPNVLLILMEGCGATFVHAVDSLANPTITPNLNRLAAEGISFTRCYANSFRTDRGTVCTLSGYPAFPDVSVMKVPSKCEKLPSIARTLKQEGYTTHFLYGGDINFTNTKGYLLSTGYEHAYGDKDFPAEERHTHDWGVTDHLAFRRLLQMTKEQTKGQPWHMAFLTLSSHEPWEVPYHRIPNDPIANSMAYLDQSIGHFIEAFRKTPQWENTLVIFTSDHGINHPKGISDADPRKSHIPMIWTGGAIKRSRRIDILCNQTDLCATLLGQLGLPHKEFRFSRDILADTYDRPSAVHVWSEGICWMEEDGHTSINLTTRPQTVICGPSSPRQDAANAYLQTCYDDLGSPH